VLSGLERQPYDPNLLVGFDKADDAGVYRLARRSGVGADARFLHADCRRPFYLWSDRRLNSINDVWAMGRHTGDGDGDHVLSQKGR